MKTNKSTLPESADRLFAQATEDISQFSLAAENWPEAEDPASWLLAMAVGLGRGRLALARLAEVEHGEDKKYLQKLEAIFQRAETAFLGKLSENSRELARCFEKDGHLWQELLEMERLLGKVRDIAREGRFFNNEEWIKDELIQAGLDFLLLLDDLAWLARVSHSAINSLSGFKSWQEYFERIEARFHKSFGYFQPLAATLVGMRDRNYGVAFWWFMEIPGPGTVQDSILTNEQVRAMGEVLHRAGLPIENCPEDLVIALALGDEITPAKRSAAERHMENCDNCRKLYNNTKESDVMARSTPITFPAWLLNLTQEKATPVLELLYSDSYSFEAEYQAIPKYQRLPETTDLKERKHPIDISLPPLEQIEHLKMTGGYAAVLQSSEIAFSTLVGDAATEEKSMVWAKIAEVIDGVMKSLSIVAVEGFDRSKRENRFTFAGSLPAWLPLPEKFQWFCDWLQPDGTLMPPLEFSAMGRNFKAIFEFKGGKGKNRGKMADMQGELRLLVITFD